MKVGDTFSFWTIIDRDVPAGHGKCRKWICRCKCGVVRSVSGSCLREGRSKSCGCKYYSKSKSVNGDPNEAAFHQLFINYKSAAKRRGYVFDISKDWFRDLTLRSCFYCGREPFQVLATHNGKGRYIYNGLDRLEPGVGYIESNCVPCCGRCNEMKMGDGSQEFLLRIKRVYEHNIDMIEFLSVNTNEVTLSD